MIFKRLSCGIMAQARIGQCRRDILMSEGVLDQVEVDARLGHPRTDRSSQVVKAEVLDAGRFANATPGLGDVHEMMPLLGAWKDVWVPFLLRNAL